MCFWVYFHFHPLPPPQTPHMYILVPWIRIHMEKNRDPDPYNIVIDADPKHSSGPEKEIQICRPIQKFRQSTMITKFALSKFDKDISHENHPFACLLAKNWFSLSLSVKCTGETGAELLQSTLILQDPNQVDILFRLYYL